MVRRNFFYPAYSVLLAISNIHNKFQVPYSMFLIKDFCKKKLKCPRLKINDYKTQKNDEMKNYDFLPYIYILFEKKFSENFFTLKLYCTFSFIFKFVYIYIKH